MKFSYLCAYNLFHVFSLEESCVFFWKQIACSLSAQLSTRKPNFFVISVYLRCI